MRFVSEGPSVIHDGHGNEFGTSRSGAEELMLAGSNLQRAADAPWFQKVRQMLKPCLKCLGTTDKCSKYWSASFCPAFLIILCRSIKQGSNCAKTLGRITLRVGSLMETPWLDIQKKKPYNLERFPDINRGKGIAKLPESRSYSEQRVYPGIHWPLLKAGRWVLEILLWLIDLTFLKFLRQHWMDQEEKEEW